MSGGGTPGRPSPTRRLLCCSAWLPPRSATYISSTPGRAPQAKIFRDRWLSHDNCVLWGGGCFYIEKHRQMDSCPVCAASGADAPAPSCPLAAEWEDEERMEFLTSHVAPGDLNARLDLISFWSKAVAHACEQAPGLSVDPAALASTSLDWGGATAPGLGLAIQHMLSAGTLVPRSNIEVGAFAVAAGVHREERGYGWVVCRFRCSLVLPACRRAVHTLC